MRRNQIATGMAYSTSSLSSYDRPMSHPTRESWTVVVISTVALATALIFVALTIAAGRQGWLNVGAAFLGIEAILCLTWEYFNPPRAGDNIRAPNRAARRSAGIVGIASGVFWVIGSWPCLIGTC
jgi:hypothetical protein